MASDWYRLAHAEAVGKGWIGVDHDLDLHLCGRAAAQLDAITAPLPPLPEMFAVVANGPEEDTPLVRRMLAAFTMIVSRRDFTKHMPGDPPLALYDIDAFTDWCRWLRAQGAFSGGQFNFERLVALKDALGESPT